MRSSRAPEVVVGRPGAPVLAVRAGVLAACAGALATAALAVTRVVVEGDSMEPTLRAGDRLLAVRVPPRLGAAVLRRGQLVAAPDPRHPERLLVKRVASVAPGTVELAGDNAARSTDSRAFGPVPAGSVRGLVVYRYAPAARAGLLRPRAGGRGHRRFRAGGRGHRRPRAARAGRQRGVPAPRARPSVR